MKRYKAAVARLALEIDPPRSGIVLVRWTHDEPIVDGERIADDELAELRDNPAVVVVDVSADGFGAL